MSIEAMKQVKQELEHIQQYGYATDIDHTIKTLGLAIVDAQKQEPTKLFGPNLEQILNAAGFYRQRELVNLTDEEIEEIAKKLVNDAAYCTLHFAVAIQRKFRRKNGV
jgi:transcriptional antiterminator